MHFLKDLNTCKEGAMMDRDFERAVEFVLAHEKYRANDPHDPAGLTIWGLSSRYHPEVRKMKNMSKEDAKEIAKEVYYREYWKRAGEGLRWPLSLIVFDTAVNMGVKRAVKMLQRILNIYLFDIELAVDGVLGPKTQRAAREAMHTHYYPVCYAYTRERVKKYLQSPKFKHFGRGWIRRVLDLEDYI